MGLSWPLGVNTENCVVWAGGAVTSRGKEERPPAVALLIGWGVGYSTGGSDDTAGWREAVLVPPRSR